MSEAMRSPTLESLEEKAHKTRVMASELEQSLESLMRDLGAPFGSEAKNTAERPKPSAVIARIGDIQQDGLSTLADCGRLLDELRRQLFSTPINQKANVVGGQSLGQYIGARIA